MRVGNHDAEWKAIVDRSDAQTHEAVSLGLKCASQRDKAIATAEVAAALSVRSKDALVDCVGSLKRALANLDRQEKSDLVYRIHPEPDWQPLRVLR